MPGRAVRFRLQCKVKPLASNIYHPLFPLIRKLENIAALTDEERRAIGSLPVETQVLRPRQNIVRDGDSSSQCCLILEGWACRYKVQSKGKRQIFSFHVAGDIPDLQSLCVPRMDHSLVTLATTTIALIPHEDLRDLTARFPNLAVLFWRDTLVDAAIFREWMMCVGRRSASEHIAHLFCELYLKQAAVGLADKHRCPLPVTQTDIADATGLSHVHVSRVLKEMRSQGLITLHERTLVIHDWEKLLQASEFDATYLHHGPGHIVQAQQARGEAQRKPLP